MTVIAAKTTTTTFCKGLFSHSVDYKLELCRDFPKRKAPFAIVRTKYGKGVKDDSLSGQIKESSKFLLPDSRSVIPFKTEAEARDAFSLIPSSVEIRNNSDAGYSR